MGRRLLVLIPLCLCLLAPPVWAEEGGKRPTVMFLSPADVSDRPFWQKFLGFMRAAADDLGIDLRIVPSDNNFLVVQHAQAALAEAVPDYAIFAYQAKTSVDLLPLLEQAGVWSVICNTEPVEREREEVGRPRERYAHWIGQISPDDLEAGRASARLLIDRGLALGLAAPDGKLHMACIGASGSISSGVLREQGLRRAVREEPHAVMDRFVRAAWRRDKARYKADLMLDMYPLARVYWASGDNMALGILDAAEARGLKPSVDFLTAGIGWTDEGIRAVREGRLAASFGGHFMEGAWALVLILDHYNGHDFAASGTTLRTRMRRIDRDNLDAYLPALDPGNWKRIDFKRFSKTFNPCPGGYDFTPEAVLRQLTGK